jgi:hypothetical protein
MLTVTYADCLADPTYCQDGKTGGALLVQKMGIKPNQPVPLANVFHHVTLREALWCLRVCRKSQQTEARICAWSFIATCVTMFPQTTNEDIMEYIHCRRDGKRYTTDKQLILADRYTWLEREEPVYKIARIAVEDRSPSQICIDVAEEAIKQAAIHYDDQDAEQKLRNALEGLLNGKV